MSGKPDRDIEKAYPAARFAAKLRRLADCIERDEPFTIQVAGERIRVPRDAIFDVEHEREDGEEEIEFQLKWSSASADARRASDGDDSADDV